MEDSKSDNWPDMCPFVQGMMNCRIPRKHSRSPFELVFGKPRREGYKNNTLSPVVLDALLNENGLDAIRDVGTLASTTEVVQAVTSAQ